MQKLKSSLWELTIHRLFDSVGLVLIGSKRKNPWKIGKTNFALYISEELIRLGIVTKVASNIDTDGTYPQISDLLNLREWLYGDKNRKLYILDEINVHAPRRRAMSNKNIGILQIFPEISKAHARLIGVGQNLKEADKQFTSAVWSQASFLKVNLKNVELHSHLTSRTIRFGDIPATTIPYDPYKIAPFTEKPLANVMFKDEELQVLYEWAVNKKTWKELDFKHPQQFNRWLRKQAKKFLDIKTSHNHTYIE